MKFKKVLHDLDSLSEELGIITKQNYEFILANLNWEKGANNELTQFGCKLSNLYSFSMQNRKNTELAETIPTIVDNLLSNLNKGSLTLLEETLLTQFRKLFLDQVHEFFSGIDMITERIGHLWRPGLHILEKISSASLKTTWEHFPSVRATCPCPQN